MNNMQGYFQAKVELYLYSIFRFLRMEGYYVEKIVSHVHGFGSISYYSFCFL